jgi:hypothetical protein
MQPKAREMRAPLSLCFALLALLGQLFATPTHPMASSADPTEIARELKAVFGDAATLCVQADSDGGSGAPRDTQHHCDECPLCRAGASAHAFLVPEPTYPPARMRLRPERIGPPADLIARTPRRTAFAQPRAPPLQA